MTANAAFRQRQREEERRLKRDQLRATLPALTRRQIRRFRVPLHEAICMELEEDGFYNTALVIEILINCQEQMSKRQGEVGTVPSFLRLSDAKAYLTRLANDLREAEICHNHNLIDKEIIILLKLATFFADQGNSWWWICNQIFIQCVLASQNYTRDGGRKHAIVRYTYGRFLLYDVGNPEAAKEHLGYCREACLGKSWVAQPEMPEPKGTIFKECCEILYKSLLQIAKSIKNSDPNKAARLCFVAQKRAAEAENDSGVSECLLFYAQCLISSGNANYALNSINKLLNIFIQRADYRNLCKVRIQLALAYAQMGKQAESRANLESVMEMAQQYDLTEQLAYSYKYLGELYLAQNKPRQATPFLTKALKLFHQLGENENAGQMRHLTAVSAGQELLPLYSNLVMRSDGKPSNLRHLRMLLKWKDSRSKEWAVLERRRRKSEKIEKGISLTEDDVSHDEEEEDLRKSSNVPLEDRSVTSLIIDPNRQHLSLKKLFASAQTLKTAEDTVHEEEISLEDFDEMDHEDNLSDTDAFWYDNLGKGEERMMSDHGSSTLILSSGSTSFQQNTREKVKQVEDLNVSSASEETGELDYY